MEASHNEDLKPCRICVDFYGSSQNGYLCSRCMREEQNKEAASAGQRELEQSASALQTEPVEIAQLPLAKS